MRRFEEICKEVGYDRFLKAPSIDYIYYVYSAGVAREVTQQDYSKWTGPKERVEDDSSKLKYDSFWDKQKRLESKAFEIWEDELRKEYPELSDKHYGLCYDEAYSRGHHAGCDEVASYMNDVVEFAMKFLKV